MRAYTRDGLLPSEVELALERTDCFGSCPVYTVRVKGTGEVTYEGARYVKIVGHRDGKISEADVLMLIDALLARRFFDADDEYVGSDHILRHEGRFILSRAVTSDVASTVLRLRLAKHEKTVRIREADPLKLQDVAKELDDTVEIEQWIGTWCERPRSAIGPFPQPGECNP